MEMAREGSRQPSLALVVPNLLGNPPSLPQTKTLSGILQMDMTGVGRCYSGRVNLGPLSSPFLSSFACERSTSSNSSNLGAATKVAGFSSSVPFGITTCRGSVFSA